MGIKTAIQLEAWNVANTNRLSATHSIQCVLSNCEVNNSVFLGCITKMRTGISSNVMAPKFASNYINVQCKNIKVEESLWRPGLSQVQVFQWRKDLPKV